MTPGASLKDRIDAVVIGASAGAVEALSTILPALPRALKPAIFIVVHLLRGKPSLMADIFQTRCALPVREAEDKEPIADGTIYFAPPDYHLLVDEGREGRRLSLSVDEPVNYSRPSIDVLFESAADLYGERLMGVILTGANADGAAGLEAVHRAGGVTVVQKPETALAPTMIDSALKRVSVDYVLSLDEIATLMQSLNCRSHSDRMSNVTSQTG